MTPAEFEQWAQGNGSGRESYHANRINYVFVKMNDGWIAIFEKDPSGYTPLIQAADRAHAESYCYMREPVPVPAQRLC